MVNDSLGGLKFGTDGEGNYGYFGDDDVLVPFSNVYDLVKNTNYSIMSGGINSESNTIPTLGMNIHLNTVGHYATGASSVTVYGVKSGVSTQLGNYGSDSDIICKDYDYIQFTFGGTGYYTTYNYVK